MNAASQSFVKLIQPSSLRFVVPVYPRPYSWDREHCEQLWDDILLVKIPGSDGDWLRRSRRGGAGVGDVGVVGGESGGQEGEREEERGDGEFHGKPLVRGCSCCKFPSSRRRGGRQRETRGARAFGAVEKLKG